MMDFSIHTFLRIEAVCASTMLVLCIWPLVRAFSGLFRDLKKGGTGLIVSMLIVWFVAVFLRLVVANVTFLYSLPDLHMHFERLFSPMGPAAIWHHHNGMGGYVLHSVLAQLFGRSYQGVWVVNGLLGSLSPLLLYLVTLKLLNDRRAAFIAAALLAVFPPAVRVDASEQIHSLSILLVLLTYFSILEALEKPRLRSYLAAGIAGAAAMHMRAEAMPHVFFACVLAVMRVRGLARPRWGLPLFLGIVVLSVPTLPRGVLILFTIVKEGPAAWGAGFGVLFDLFFSGHHLYVNPLYSLPVYPLLTLAGIVWLIVAKNYRLLAFLLTVLVVQYFMYLCNWTLDTNEALRFQAHMWFVQIMMAGIGLAGLSRLAGSRIFQGASIAAGIAVAAFSLIPAQTLLLQPQEADQDVLFFEERIGRLPPECRLVMFRASRRETGSRCFISRTWPMWLLNEWNRGDTLAYPKDLEEVSSIGGCRIVHVGIDCYRRYPADDMSEEQIKKAFYEESQPFLYEFLDAWHAKLDQGSPPLMRPECRELFDRFQLEPLETTTITPGRRTWIWSPRKPVVVGFYSIN